MKREPQPVSINCQELLPFMRTLEYNIPGDQDISRDILTRQAGRNVADLT